MVWRTTLKSGTRCGWVRGLGLCFALLVSFGGGFECLAELHIAPSPPPGRQAKARVELDWQNLRGSVRKIGDVALLDPGSGYDDRLRTEIGFRFVGNAVPRAQDVSGLIIPSEDGSGAGPNSIRVETPEDGVLIPKYGNELTLVIDPPRTQDLKEVMRNVEWGDEIQLQSGVYFHNFRLGETSPVNLTIRGRGMGRTVISGGQLGSVFRLGGLASIRLVLEDLTLIDGLAENGGGIFNQYGEVILRRCEIKNCRAYGPSGEGGAIYNEGGGSVRLEDCKVHHNAALRAGGGISNSGLNTSILPITPGVTGGATRVVERLFDALVTLSELDGAATAEKLGKVGQEIVGMIGPVLSSLARLIPEGEEVGLGIKGLLTEQQGGRTWRGFWRSARGPVTELVRTRVFENQVGQGIKEAVNAYTVYATNPQTGERILDHRSQPIPVFTHSPEDHRILGMGAGVHNALGYVWLEDSQVSDNESRTRIGALGGGISSFFGMVRMQDSQVLGNLARAGSVYASGGGLYSGVSWIQAERCGFNENEAKVLVVKSSGGGISSKALSFVELDECQVNGNVSGGGGGIANEFHSILQVRRSTVADNSISGIIAAFGGGISNENGGVLMVSDSTISGNKAVGLAKGGGVYNHAETGDSEYIRFSLARLHNTTISGNEVDGKGTFGIPLFALGGGIYNGAHDKGLAILEVHSNTIYQNRAHNGFPAGGGIYLSGLAGKNLKKPGAAQLGLGNSIIAANRPDDGSFLPSPIIPISHGWNLDSDGTMGIIMGLSETVRTSGEFRTEAEVLLAPLGHNGGPTKTHALLSGSPALDRGEPDQDPNALQSALLDQRGYQRSLAGRRDIGAFESGGPIANVDLYGEPGSERVFEDQSFRVEAPGVLGNDFGDDQIAEFVAGAAFGLVQMASDGSFLYRPNPGFNGVDQFQYRVVDSQGRRSEPKVVQLRVSSTLDLVELSPDFATPFSQPFQEFRFRFDEPVSWANGEEHIVMTGSQSGRILLQLQEQVSPFEVRVINLLPFQPGETVSLHFAAELSSDTGAPLVQGQTIRQEVLVTRPSDELTPAFQMEGNFRGHSLFVDLDHDGDLDLVGPSRKGGVWLNQGDGTYVDTGQQLGTEDTLFTPFFGDGSAVAAGDLNGDYHVDLVVIGSLSFQKPSVWVGDGAGRFRRDEGLSTIDAVDGHLEAFGTDVKLEDFNSDGFLDLFVTRSHSSPQFSHNLVFLNLEGTGFAKVGQVLDSSRSESVALADLNGDGNPDAFVGNAGVVETRIEPGQNGGPATIVPLRYESNRVYLGSGNGRFSATPQMLGDRETTSVVLGDLDGNGTVDAVAGNGDDGIQLWLNDGLGNFVAGSRIQGNWERVLLGDFDADQDLDLVGTRRSGPMRLCVNQGDGSFVAGQSFEAGGLRLAKGDTDQDGDLDLVVSGFSETRFFENAILPVASDRVFEVGEDGTLVVSAMDGLVGTGVTANLIEAILGTEVYRDTLGGLWNRFGYGIDTHYEGTYPNGSYVFERPSRPGHGELELKSDGSFVYRPKANFHGTDTFTFALQRGFAVGAEATVTINVRSVLDPPIGRDDLYQRVITNSQGERKVGRNAGNGVLANDRKIETGDLTASLIEDPMHGTVALNPDGSFTYTAGNTFEVTDSFLYAAMNQGKASEPTRVRIGRHAIEAQGELYERDLSAAFTILANEGVLANDLDPNIDWIPGAVTEAQLRSGPSKGTLDLGADGAFTYTPNPGAEGTDVFVYRARTKVPGHGFVQYSEEVRVKIGNTRPVAVPDGPYVSIGGQPIVVGADEGVLANDVDADGDPLVIAAVPTRPTKGQLTMNSDGSFTYTPAAGASGVDFFEYRSRDPYRWAFKTRVDIELVNPLRIERMTPAAHALASPDSDIIVEFDQDILLSSVSDRIVLHGSQNGRLGGIARAQGNVLTISPAKPFLLGETVSVTLIAGIRSTDVAGVSELEHGRHWQFQVGGSRGGRQNYTAVDLRVKPRTYGGHVVGDFNEDALPDLVISEYLGGPILILNQGDRTFTERTLSFSYQNDDEVFEWDPSATSSTSARAKAGDFDRDGDLDLVVRVNGKVNGGATSSRHLVAWNDGQGRFDDFEVLPLPDGGRANFFFVGDFDLDGDLDIMMVGSIGVWIVFNEGNGSFYFEPNETVVLEVGSLFPLGAGRWSDFEVVDYDSDGDLDAIAMGREGMVWMRNDGRGRFSVEGTQLGDGGDGAYAFADFDQDGFLDVWRRHFQDTSGQILLGTAPDAYVGGARTSVRLFDVRLGDLDGDGRLDLWGYHGSDHRTLFGQEDGLYPVATEHESVGNVLGLALADFDGDGDLDVYSGEHERNALAPSADRIWFNESPPLAKLDHYPADGQNIIEPNARDGVLANDDAGDGSGLEAVLREAPQHGSVVLAADGSFRYTPGASFEGKDVFLYAARDSLGSSEPVRVKIGNTRAQAVADVFVLTAGEAQTVRAPGVLANDSDADGDPLEARLNEAPSRGRVELRGDGSFTYWPEEGFVGTDSFKYRAHDGVRGSVARVVTLEVRQALELTGIEPADYATGIAADTDLVIRFSAPLNASTVGSRVRLVGDRWGGYDVTTEVNQDQLTVRANRGFFAGETLRLTLLAGLRGQGGENLSLPLELRFVVSAPTGEGAFGFSNQNLGRNQGAIPYYAAGDLDQDGDVDVVASQWASGELEGVVEIWKNDGAGQFTVANQTLLPRGNQSRSGEVQLGDLDGDGDLDIILETGAIWKNRGDGSFVAAPAAWPEASSDLIVLGDLDADGDPDLVRAWTDNTAEDFNDWTRHVFLYRNDGSGSFSHYDAGLQGLHTEGFRVIAIAVGDLNGDRLPDLVVRPPFPSFAAGHETSIWINQGGGQFKDSDLRLVPANRQTFGGAGLRINDIDGDGDLDLLMPSNEESFVWRNNGQGGFERTSQTFPGRDIEAITMGDFDSDGDLDVLALQDVENVFSDVLLHNDGNGVFEIEAAQLASDRSARSVLADFDGQGSIDLLLGGRDAFDALLLNGSVLAPLVSLDSLALSDQETVKPFAGLSLSGAESRFLVTLVTVENPEQGVFSDDSLASAGMTKVSDGIYQLVNRRMGGTVNRLGRLVFVPAENRLPPGQMESVNLRLTITDREVTRETGRTLFVTSVNDAPVGMDDFGDGFSTGQSRAFTTANVLANDVDVDAGDQLTYLEVDVSGTVGQVTELGDGRFDYDPGTAFIGLPGGETAMDSFRYLFRDAAGELSSATVHITLNGWNNWPKANPDEVTVGEHAGEVVVSSTLLANDTDVDIGHGEALRIDSLDKTSTQGTVRKLDDETVVYDPTSVAANLALGESVQDSFRYRALDPQGRSSTLGTVTVTIVGEADAPVAVDDQLVFGEDEPARDVTAALLSNDQDADPGQQALLQIIGFEATEATQGAVVLRDGVLTYSPNGRFETLPQGGRTTDEFEYLIADADGLTARAKAVVEIQGANDFPRAEADSTIVAEGSGLTDLTALVLTNDSDIDEGDRNSLRIVSVDASGSAGTVQFDGNRVSYRPDSALTLRGDEQVEDQIQYTIEDAGGLRSEETISVLIVGANADPVAVAQSFSVDQNQSHQGSLEGTDGDGDALTFALAQGPEKGTVAIQESGQFSYQPSKNFNGTDSFTFTVFDGEAVSQTGLVQIVVNPGSDVVTIESRYLFYNRSAFDGNDPASNAADDGALATDKVALLPGELARFDHVSSYSRGLNGVMIDFRGLAGDLSLADFSFKVGNDNDPDAWAAGPTPTGITRRVGGGTNGSDRVTLIWEDYDGDGQQGGNEAVAGKWLQVTVLANATTCLTQPDVFYFGSAVGETGDGGDFRVTTNDVLGIRDNPHSLLNPAGVTDGFDINRDTKVNPADRLIARSHRTTLADELILLDLRGGLVRRRYIPFDEGELVDTGSPWRIRLGGAHDGQSALSFNGPAGAWYEVYFTDDLWNPNWKLLEVEINEIAPGHFQIQSDLPPSESRFFRIVPTVYEASDVFPTR